jgi:hypothetical protein
MLKLFKINSLLLALCMATAPYVSLMSHAFVHQLFVFEQHHHVHGEQADQAQPQSQGQDHDHVVTIDSLSPAPLVSLVKLEVPARKVFDGSAEVLKISILNDRKIFRSSIGEAPPPLIEQFIALSLHPTNAPPLR